MGIGKKIKTFFTLSPSQSRGILVLLPLLAIAGLLIHGLGRPKSDPDFLGKADSLILPRHAKVDDGVTEPDAGPLFFFDPNTVTLEQLCDLGFELRTAAGIIKYRNAGKVFVTPEDLAMCYGVTLEQYLAVEPYIIIGEPYRRKGRPDTNHNSLRQDRSLPANVIKANGPFNPNQLDVEGFAALGFSAAQAKTIINYRNSMGGFTSAEQFGRCYAVTPEALEALVDFMVFGKGEAEEAEGEEAPVGTVDAPILPVEINSADSATLRAVSGIGEVLVVRIIDYRSRLGGFCRPEQLAEIKGMTQANYERILQQITVDSCKISKIDINFAPHKELVARLEDHPYTNARMIRKLLSVRQLKGGYTNTQELVEDKIITKEEAERLAPYLLFKPLATKE